VDASALRRDLWMLPLQGERTPQLLLGGPAFKASAWPLPTGDSWPTRPPRGACPPSSSDPSPAAMPGGRSRHLKGRSRGGARTAASCSYRWGGNLYAVRIDASHGFSASRPEKLFDRIAIAASSPPTAWPGRQALLHLPQPHGRHRAAHGEPGPGFRAAAHRGGGQRLIG
jgi:hypothetical protein